MAEAFLGLKVSVILHSGMRIEGTVSHIEPTNHQMTLQDVTLFFFGQEPHKTPVYGVVGNDIQDLSVISRPTPMPTPMPTPAPIVLDNHMLEQMPPPPLQPQKTILKNNNRKAVKQQQPMPSPRNNNKRNDEWARKDVNEFLETEFDFQKNLDMFDKRKVFAEIQASDSTAQEDLLVTLNRLPQHKMLPSENVLENQNLTDNDESDDDSQTPNEFYVSRKRKAAKKLVTESGVVCPTVSNTQMNHVLFECKRQSSMFEQLAIENGARGTALFLLRDVISALEVVSPSVVILVGNQPKFGFALARHLLNHGCLVTVCCLFGYPDLPGIQVVHHVKDLSLQTDLVIDAIMAEDEDEEDGHHFLTVIQWINQFSNVVSIDFPTGVDSNTGLPCLDEKIKPRWTICLGAPKSGCKSKNVTGQLVLVDIGVPRLAWKKLNHKRSVPWGAEFFVKLNYQQDVV